MDLTYHLYLPMGRSVKDEYREASSSHNQDFQVLSNSNFLFSNAGSKVINENLLLKA